jgi:hypothetical protein
MMNDESVGLQPEKGTRWDRPSSTETEQEELVHEGHGIRVLHPNAKGP